MSHHSLKDRISSHSEETDVVEIKKALATSGANKESAAPSAASESSYLPLRVSPTQIRQVSSIACYCLASILMTLVNKVTQIVSLHDARN